MKREPHCGEDKDAHFNGKACFVWTDKEKCETRDGGNAGWKYVALTLESEQEKIWGKLNW